MNKQKSEFSKNELVSILEIIEGAVDCRNPECLKRLLLKSKDLVEADYATSGIVRTSSPSDSRILKVVNGNYPKEWLEFYMSEEVYKIDPLLRYHGTFSMSQFWADIFKTCKDAPEKLAIDWAADFGLRHGISGSIYVPEVECMGVFVFAGGKDRFKEHHKKIIDILTLHLNSALMRFAGAPQQIPLKEKNIFNL